MECKWSTITYMMVLVLWNFWHFCIIVFNVRTFRNSGKCTISGMPSSVSLPWSVLIRGYSLGVLPSTDFKGVWPPFAFWLIPQYHRLSADEKNCTEKTSLTMLLADKRHICLAWFILIEMHACKKWCFTKIFLSSKITLIFCVINRGQFSRLHKQQMLGVTSTHHSGCFCWCMFFASVPVSLAASVLHKLSISISSFCWTDWLVWLYSEQQTLWEVLRIGPQGFRMTISAVQLLAKFGPVMRL